MARVPLLEKEQVDDSLKPMYDGLQERMGFVPNIFKTLAHAPSVAIEFLDLGRKILNKMNLDPRLRELAILRVGHIHQADYEWSHHVVIGQKVGLTMDQINGVRDWSQSPHFSKEQQTILKFTDQLIENVRVTEAIFDEIKQFLSLSEILELEIAIGYYLSISRILESLEVEHEGHAT